MNDRLNILHVISELSPGGAERVLLEIAEQQSLHGHKVTILTPSDLGARQVSITPKNVELVFTANRPARRLQKYTDMFRYIARESRQIRSFDVIHCHLTYGAVFGWLTRLLIGRKSGVMVETNHSAGMPMHKLTRAVRMQMARRFDAVALVVDDEYWVQKASHYGLPAKVIPNGIDVSKFTDLARAPKAATLESSAFVVGTVGMLRADRKPWLFIEIFAEVARRFDKGKVVFLIVGDGPMMALLKQKALDAGIEDFVEFFGVSAFPASQAIRMDVFVSLNVGNLTGMAAIEAALVGTPLVGYQMKDGYAARRDDWIWSSADVGAIADQIERLLKNDAERVLLGEKQKQYAVDRHSIGAVRVAYDSLYHDSMVRKVK
jgi:glycosyltransferase involved in cell wall biosynthesis